jgi:hypothetical protein
MTPHEAVASAAVAAIESRYLAPEDPLVTREIDLPERVPLQGLVNLRFADPVELGRAFGLGREWSRACTLEIVVQANEPALRIARYEAILGRLGALHSAQGLAGVVDYIDLGAPYESEVIPVEGASSVRAGMVDLTLFYMTSENPMEATA